MKKQEDNKAINRISKTISQKTKAIAERVKRAQGKSTGNLSSEEVLRRTQEKAFELFERRGYTHGNDWLDWTIASDIVRLQLEAGNKRRLAKALSDAELREKTERKAYELFEKTGYTQGNDYFNWSVAEEIVKLEHAPGSNGN